MHRRLLSFYAFARARRARAVGVLAAGLAVGVALVAAGAGVASTPGSSSVTVPTSTGATETRTWTGTIPPGANPTNSCAQVANTPLVDKHAVQISVPEGLYNTVDATFTFSITWENALHDEILTVLDPDGLEVGSSDGGTNVETVVASDLSSGTYQVVACAFAAGIPVAYNGKLVVTTSTPEASLPSAPSGGLEFSASVAADNQRDEAEPLLEINKDGYVFDCGPTGFSNASDYAQVSPPEQGGDQFHLLGTPPRGQQSGGGGGDCGLAFGTDRNSRGHYQYAYTGLGPLTSFATSTSPNNGRSLATGGPVGNGVSGAGAAVDRQWMTFVDADSVLLSYNQQAPRNVVVQRSDDGGLTYGPNGVIAAANPRFPGPMRYIEPTTGLPNGLVYFPWDRGNQINIAFSTTRGASWRNCGATTTPGTTTLFATADHDNAGNIYIVYGENAKFHTYMVSTSALQLVTDTCSAVGGQPALQPTLFSSPVQVDRDNVRSTVFQWVTAGGAPGRVAVVFAGTETDGNPNSGRFDATWDIYVNQSLNATAGAAFSQVKATTHPFHYDSICLNGLGCDLSVPPGDRSMADFFSLDYNPDDGRLYVTFNRSNKKPNEEIGHVATPMVVAQIAGPSNRGDTVSVPDRQPLRSSSTDATGDALSSYSTVTPGVVPPDPPSVNEPAGDFLSASIGPELDLVDNTVVPNGGFTVTMRVADLSDDALAATAARTQSQSLLWIWRFTNGHQDVAASARWNALGFTFGYNDYTTNDTPCAGAGTGDASEKCIVYPGDQPIEGSVDQATGTIRLSVPRSLLKALTGPTGHGQRPSEVPAEVGSRFFDGTAFSLGNALPTQEAQTFLYPLDNTPSMDFLLPGGDPPPPSVPCKITGSGTLNTGGKFSLNVHVGLPPKGSVSYRDAGTDFRSTELTSATCANPSRAIVEGTGRDGNGTVDFTLEVVDGGESSVNDTFSLQMEPGGSRTGTVTKGNIQIHKR